jgi:cell division septal protein FtsQ
MPQHPSKSSKSTPVRRLKTPEERFGIQPPAEINEELPLLEEIKPVAHTPEPRIREIRRREIRRHEVKLHEVKAHERHTHERHPIAGHENSVAPQPKKVIAPRAKERRKAVRRFAGRFFALGAVIFAVQLGVAALSAPQFGVKTIAIEGLNETPEASVYPLAQKLVGQNIFRANKGAVEKAIEAVPTIADAKIERMAIWPPKMRLVVTERTPVLRVGAGNSWWVVDKTGKPFRTAQAKDSSLYALTAPQFTPANGKVLPEKWWNRAVLLNEALKKDNLTAKKNGEGSRWNLRRVYMDKNGLAALRISGSEVLVRLGDDSWNEKLERARVSLDYLQKTGRRAEELNLISYEFPRWKPIVASNQSNETSRASQQSGRGMG